MHAAVRSLLLDPTPGPRRGSSALAPVPDANAGRCPRAWWAASRSPGANRLVLGGSGGNSCPTRVALRDGALAPVADWSPGGDASDAQVGAAAQAPGEDATASQVGGAAQAPVGGGTGSPRARPVRTAVAAAGAPLDLCAGVERDW